MIEVSSQASEDVTYAFPGYDSSLVGAKRPKQKLSRFQQVSTPKNKDMKRFFSSPVLPSVPQAAGNERRGFHKFQDELAKLKEAPEYSPHSSGDSSIYLKSRESQHDIEGRFIAPYNPRMLTLNTFREW